MHRQKHDLDLRIGLAQLAKAFDAIEARHREIGDHDVRRVALDRLQEARPVPHDADDVELVLEENFESLGENAMVISQDDLGRVILQRSVRELSVRVQVYRCSQRWCPTQRLVV